MGTNHDSTDTPCSVLGGIHRKTRWRRPPRYTSKHLQESTAARVFLTVDSPPHPIVRMRNGSRPNYFASRDYFFFGAGCGGWLGLLAGFAPGMVVGVAGADFLVEPCDSGVTGFFAFSTLDSP